MRIKESLIWILVGLMSLAGCSSNLTTVGNPVGTPGIQAQIRLTNEIDRTTGSSTAAITIETGPDCRAGTGVCYTPPIYSFGFRSFALFQCLASDGTPQACGGLTGQEVESTFAAGESISEDLAVLNTEVADRALFLGDEALTGLGDLVETTIEATETIQTAGLYSGFQSVLDFIMAQLPTGKTHLEADFALLCVNAKGCSSLSSYPSVFDGLVGSGAAQGDILFFRLSDSTWYFFDTDSDVLVAAGSGRPKSALNQGSFPDFDTDDTGAVHYNASFGGLPSISITEADLQVGGTVEIEIVYSVENAMSFVDNNANGGLDNVEVKTLAFGKPQIVTFEVD